MLNAVDGLVHTNCSSSLVGLHAAWQSLQLQEARLALVGAAMVFPNNRLGYLHHDDLNFSSDGRCKPFDAAADGMVGGEGVAVVLLKRAVDAVRDRDHIYAVLRGISVNNDGADKIGFYAPSSNGQARVIQKVLQSTGIDPASIGYVEAHGTGTRLGDPIEVNALSEVYQRYTDKKQFCGLGSVKSNIGHMDTAAGLAGCIKVALSLYYGEIPPSIHYQQPNPAIAFANSPFYVVDRLSPWTSATPPRAALSSFGIGGTNAHAIFEQAPASAALHRASPASESLAVLVPVAAKNDDRLRAYVSELLTFLAAPAGDNVALADLAYTFQVGRKAMPARVVFLARTRPELLRQLQAFVDGEPQVEGCFRRAEHGESDSAILRLWQEAEQRDVLLRQWCGNKALDRLAYVWVQGHDIDWGLLYEEQTQSSQPRRLSLPTYPFATEPYGWPAHHAAVPVATGTMATVNPSQEASREPRFTGSTGRTLWLHPTWEPVTVEAHRGVIWPSASQRLLIIGGDDHMQRTVLQHFAGARVCHLGAQDTVHDIVARLQAAAPEPVDHILWLGFQATGHVSGEMTVEQLEQGILPCFRTVKALLQLGYGSRNLGWTVLTAGARAVHHSEPVDPHQAALHGLVGAMAQEQRHWQVRLVDMGAAPPAMLPPLVDLCALPADRRGAAWACRRMAAGAALQWYRQQTIPLVLRAGTETAAMPYRAAGVYVVIGGAGTIGRAWSEHVIRSVGARLIWIGRRQQDATIEAALAALAALGPTPLYISADASNRQELARALQSIKQQGLTVHGVVHSAVTMLSGTLAEMDEERFRAGLRTKVDISLHLAHLFHNEPLDFMLFFSSIVSFTTHARQSSYAAGCLFQDALSQHLAQQWPGTVKSINWGYWGSSGALTASPGWLAQMAREGIAPIEPPAAMLAVDALLRGPLQRLALVKTTDASGLDGLDVNHAARIVMSPGTVLSDVAALRRLMPAMPADGRTALPLALLQSEWGLRTTALDDVLCTLLYAQLQAMGLLALRTPGARTTMADLQARLPQLYGRWMQETVAFLADHQFLTYKTLSGTVLAGPQVASGGLDIGAVWQQWEQHKKTWLEDPYKAALVVLVEATLHALPAILSGKQLATDIVYPNSSMALVEATRQHNRVADYFNEVLASAVVAYGRDLQQRGAGNGQALRFLEIGAGIGGSSRVILQQLHAAGLQGNIKEYCYSDISRAFLMHGEQQYGAANPFLTYRILNIEESLASQGFDEGSYDLVIAANVLHATKNIRRTLQHAKAALKSGGLLLLNEVSSRSLYSHLTFGLLKGWWLYEDEALRMQGSPALSPETWQGVLHEAGFRAVLFPVQESHDLGLQIIMAASDGLVRQHVGAEAVAAAVSPARSTTPASVPPPRATAAASYVADVIAEKVAAALKMRREEIEPHVPFADYGLDSILAVDLVDAINHTLAIQLKTTSVFDHSAVSRLAAHVLAEYGARFQEPVAAPAAPYRASEPPPLAVPLVQAPTTAPPPPLDAVAVIGLAVQCPDASDPETFWRHLVTGHDAVRAFLPADAAATHTAQWAGLVPERDCFDPLFFNIAPREALSMSLHQRLVLQESWKALEDAGYNPRDLAETQVGMFIGAEPAEYFHETFTGASDAIVAARLSYFLNLNGPALVVNTACSSSATAIHLACESLRHGESSIALAGGVAAPMDYATLLRLRDVGMLSPGGRCRPFDAAGDGTVLAEGVGIVVLKRLQEAVADGDHIYGVIVASGVNQDGASNGITAPNGQAQERLITSVYRRYGINPADITYVEAHGTGTKLGDPVEANALVRAFTQFTDKQHYCVIGSAKAHIGHTTAAAGVIGLIKILLSFRHRCIPGLLHFTQLNPHIDFANTPFYINTAALPWQADKPRTAALNSFGHSGTNVHLVVQEYPQAAPTPGYGGPYLIPLSARNEERLRDYAAKLLAFLITSDGDVVPDVAAMACTLQTGREAMDERLLFLVRDSAELAAGLQAFVHGQQWPGPCWRGQAKQGRELVNLFAADTEVTGLFSQWVVDGKIHKIAELWVHGLPVDWASLYGAGRPFGPRPERLSLPTYPFARERYDKPAPLAAPSSSTNGTTGGLDVLHPLVQRNTSNLADIRFSSTFTGREFFLDDHRVRGQRVFPGVAYLEMAREAVRQAVTGMAGFEAGAPRIRLQEVVWIRPIRVAVSADGQPLPLRLDIRLRPEERPDGLRLAYDIIVVSSDGEGTVHGQGVALLDHAAEQPTAPILDLDDLHRQCNQGLFTSEQCYPVYEEAGISYGPGHRGLVKVLVGALHGEPRLLAQVCVPPAVADKRFVLHPGLMDAALQAIVGFFIGSDANMQPALPFALESLEIFNLCAPTMWALIRPTEGGSQGLLQGGGNKTLRKMDIDLCDGSGTVAVRLQGLTARVLGEDGPPGGAASTPPDTLLTLTPVWDVVTATQHEQWRVPAFPVAGHRVLIAAADDPWSVAVAAAIRAQVPEAIQLRTAASIDAIAETLAGLGALDHLFWIAPVAGTSPVDELVDGQEQPVLPLFRAIKALLRLDYGYRPLGLTLLTSRAVSIHGAAVLNPLHAAMHGLLGALDGEYPHWVWLFLNDDAM